MIIALGLVHPGPHLRQMNFPLKGTASWNHLCNPTNLPAINCGKKSVQGHKPQGLMNLKLGDHNLDECMRTVSDMLGCQNYERDTIELNLCESKYGRCLDKVDVFKFGQRIFNVMSNGCPVYKNFGSHGPWIPCAQANHNLKFITP